MVRTMTITGLVTGFMVLIAGVFILTSIGTDLYSSRKEQALQDSARATLAAQRHIDASDASDRGGLSLLSTTVRRMVQDTSSSQLMYLRRQPGQASFPEAPPPTTTANMLIDTVYPRACGSTLNEQEPQHWQAVTFLGDDGSSSPESSSIHA